MFVLEYRKLERYTFHLRKLILKFDPLSPDGSFIRHANWRGELLDLFWKQGSPCYSVSTTPEQLCPPPHPRSPETIGKLWCKSQNRRKRGSSRLSIIHFVVARRESRWRISSNHMHNVGMRILYAGLVHSRLWRRNCVLLNFIGTSGLSLAGIIGITEEEITHLAFSYSALGCAHIHKKIVEKFHFF